MFIQVIQGKVKDADLLQRQFERWLQELKPGATGYLGSTEGTTPDGRAITIARFESEEAAQANSDRPEQGAWWNETEKGFDGEVTFKNSTDVDTLLGGGSDDAGFVQVMQGRAKDQEQMRAAMSEMEAQLRDRRPDLKGIVVAWHGNNEFTQAVYFTSEGAARQGEQATQDERDDEFGSLLDGELTFFDLPEPTLD
jgi:hypothetical protein